MPLALLAAMRPKQWLKNVLVLAAPVAAGVVDERSTAIHTLLAFIAFCLASSATYLLNDVRDIDADRRHPTKRRRPIAAGTVSVPMAMIAAALLLITALAIAFVTATNLGLTILGYLALTTVYSFWFKTVAILDIVCVAAGFVLRTIAGATAAEVPISEWFFIVTSFGALFMVAGKREGESIELAEDASTIRATLGVYTPRFLAYLRSVTSGVVLVAYCLWAFASAEGNPSGGAWFKLSIVPFVIAILRYSLLIEQGKGAEPENLVLSDRTLLVAGAAWAMIYGYATYA